ncbi:MAG: peptidoglycan-binding domain-containing protein [Hyphomicrobiales bacterium]
MVRKAKQGVIVSGKSPIISVVAGLCFSVAIAYNALGRQDARHPAPIEGFWNLQTGSTTKQSTALQPRGTDRRNGRFKPSKVVSDIQRDLTSMGLYGGDIDGLNGPRTRAAIMRYEKKYQLPARGLPTTRLLEHIRFNKRILDAVESSPKPNKPGANHKVHLVQTGLAELGYSPGPVDGVLGEQTKQAIREFERHRRLRVTGQVSDMLIRELHKMTGLSSLDLDNING